jgi:hypothetical protein
VSEAERIAEAKRLARCRTLVMVAASKVSGVPEGHPQRAALQRKMNALRGALRAQELAYEVER